ncbi:MAG: fused MFS/spermidine synthase, partial [Myxococcaceae bacterium]
VVAALLLYPNEPSVVLALGGHLGFLFVACVACHGELVKLRPAEGHLTSFYLSVSIGGGAGGAFVALVAPVLFKDFWELQLTLALAVVVVAVEVARTASKRVTQALLAATTLVVVLLGWSVASRGRTVIERRRDFFGVVRVQSDPRGLVLVHGRVAHGAQFADPARARVPTAYYAPPSGVGRLLSAPSGPRHIGGIGLGLGTIAGYARPGDTLRFYEISPSVVAYATGAGGYFTFLSGAPTPPEVVLGDARTSLEREPPNAFDVLVVDAFSGDSVPTHLLTREALQLYLRHLRGPGSVIAVHVSNWYLDLHPVVAALAKDLGLTVVRLESESTEGWAIPSSWMLLARDPEALRALPSNEVVPSGGPVWTDEFTSLWGLVQW